MSLFMSFRTPPRVAVLSFFWLRLASAAQFFSNNTVPANLTTACSNALLKDVTGCSSIVPVFQNGYFYPPSTLEKTCTTECAVALTSYESEINTACSGQTWAGYDDGNDMTLAIIPNLIRYQYDLTCLQDSARWCNVVALAAAVSADPGLSPVGWDSSADNNTEPSGPCDLCFIKSLRMQAASPYYDGPELRSQSIYQSKTSSCGVVGYPLTTSTLGFSTPPAEATPTPSSCAGEIYAVKASDDCYSISKAQSIGTAWLLSDNNLAAYCADFPTSGNLCLVNTCKVYEVGTNDTCKGIAKAANITVPQLKAWNPVINAGCYNLEKMNGTQICVSGPGTPYVIPTVPPTLAPSTASTAVPIPTDAAEGANTYCGKWYKAIAGDYCNLLTIKFGISLQDFVFLNPVINENCTNLYADESYCVQAVGDINTYSGRPGYHTPGPSSSVPFTKLPVTPTSASPSTTPTSTGLPLAAGTRDDCSSYFDGAVFQTDISETNWQSQCQFAAALYNVDLDDFGLWNPDVGNVTLASCSFKTGVQYCGKLYFGERPPSAQVPLIELPVREGTSPNCTQFGDVPDDWQCSDVLSYYSLTIAQFSSYNPIVGSDCGNLWPGYAYCVRGPGYSDPALSTSYTSGPSGPTATTLSPASSTAPGPSEPTFSGQPANCIKWYTIQDGDGCSSVENMFFITHAQFLEWNPAVSQDCGTNFWKGYAYCVGTADTVTVTRISSTPAATPTPITVPTPNQPNNAVSNCNKFDQAIEGDYCSRFADRNGITLEQLYAWNSVLDNGNGCGSSFWKDYYYCVGVSG